MSDLPWDDPYVEIHADEYLEPAPNPVCCMCGAGMAIKRMEPDALIWHCDGALGWDKWGGAILAPGRWRNDPHSVRSQVERRR